MKLLSCLNVFVAVIFIQAVSAQEKSKTPTAIMGLGPARKILLSALRHEGITRKPGFNVEYYDGQNSRFYFYAAEWDTPKWAAAVGTGHYAVNRVTGDVWEIMECRKLTSRSTAKLQRQVREWLKVSPEEYRRAAAAQPCP